MRKNAQLQMGESISIIIVVLILLVLVLVFYGNIKKVDIQDKKIEFEDERAIQMSGLAYSLPEIQCSQEEVTNYNCLDLLKYEFLAEMISDSYTGTGKTTFFYYRELFGMGRINLKIIYNDGTIENKPLYDTGGVVESELPIYMPIVVYDPLSHRNNFAVLEVVKYV